MTIKDLYNALEKAIDSGKASLDANVIIGVEDDKTGLSATIAQTAEILFDGLMIKAKVDFKW